MGPPELKPEPPALEWARVPPSAVTSRSGCRSATICKRSKAVSIPRTLPSCIRARSRRDPLFVGSKGNVYNERDQHAHFDVVDFEGGLLIGARRNAGDDRYYWRITPYIMPWYTIIPPRAGHPLGAHAWVPIDDHKLLGLEHQLPSAPRAHRSGTGRDAGRRRHPLQVRPRHVRPAANRTNDYLIDRAAQKAGIHYSGVEGIAMQDASLQESMGPIQDRTRENLCPTDLGIVCTRRLLLKAAADNRCRQPLPALPRPSSTCARARSCCRETNTSRTMRGTGFSHRSTPIRLRYDPDGANMRSDSNKSPSPRVGKRVG